MTVLWKKRFFAKRTWLNRDVTARAAMIGHVKLSLSQWRDSTSYELDAGISFSDCNRTAALEFDVYAGEDDGPSDLADRRDKARRLRTFVNDWCDAYEAALDAMAAKVEAKP